MAKIVKFNQKKQSKLNLKPKTAPSKNIAKPRKSLKFNQKKPSRVNLNQKSSPFSNLSKQQKIFILCAIIALVIIIIIAAAVVWISIAGVGNSGIDNIIGGTIDGETDGETDGDPEDGGNPGGGSGSIYGEVIGFGVSSKPYKTTYYVGDEPVYDGLSVQFSTDNVDVLTVYYESTPEAFTITGFDSSAPVSSQTITVEYAGQTATFTIKILEVPTAPATLRGIRLDPAPIAEVPYGYAPDVRGSNIICEYSDGTTKVVPLEFENLSNYEEDILAASPGDQVTIKVVYTEGGITAETSFTVTITE